MILCNHELHQALDEGRLIIEPTPEPRFPDGTGECPFGTHSVDLRLGGEIVVPEAGPFAFDLESPGNLAEFIGRNSHRVTLPHTLEPHSFVLGNTLERVALPIPEEGTTCLGARIEGKSSRARLGLLIHFTAPTVHPGFEGNLTLEMINLGIAPIRLYQGMYIAQLIVEEVRGLPFHNPSQFQGQNRPEGTP